MKEGGAGLEIFKQPEKARKTGRQIHNAKSRRRTIRRTHDVVGGKKEFCSAQALAMRQEILPDHKLLNTALGLYSDRQSARHKATVKAFIDEYHRVEKLINKAKTGRRLDAIKPDYPTSILDADE